MLTSFIMYVDVIKIGVEFIIRAQFIFLRKILRNKNFRIFIEELFILMSKQNIWGN